MICRCIHFIMWQSFRNKFSFFPSREAPVSDIYCLCDFSLKSIQVTTCICRLPTVQSQPGIWKCVWSFSASYIITTSKKDCDQKLADNWVRYASGKSIQHVLPLLHQFCPPGKVRKLVWDNEAGKGQRFRVLAVPHHLGSPGNLWKLVMLRASGSTMQTSTYWWKLPRWFRRAVKVQNRCFHLSG